MTKLNDTQTILLSTASQRDSGSLYPLPDMLAAGARIKAAITKLVGCAYAAEREVEATDLSYRNDGDLRFGVFITPAGLAAIGIASEDSVAPKQAPPPPPPATKPNKSATVLALLARAEGATLAELIAVTDWLPHTTRAALTGLRKKGHAITRGKRGDVTCYQIVAAA